MYGMIGKDRLSMISASSPTPVSSTARAPARNLLIQPVNFDQEKFGSTLGPRGGRIPVLGGRISALGHTALVPSFGRFRKDPVFACRRITSVNSGKGNFDDGIRVFIQEGGRESDRTKNSVMIMDVVEATGVRSHARWGAPLAVSIQALLVVLVTAVLVQLRFSHLVPKIALFLSTSFSFLLPKSVDSKCSKGREKKSEASEAIEFSFANLDHESARRRARAVYQGRIYDTLGITPDRDVSGLKITEKYEVNSRNVEIFSKYWIPKTGSIKAAICFCHGYGDTCTFFFEGIARKLASMNFSVFAMDYAGFGLSGGLHGYIPSFDLLVDDICEHYSSLKKQQEFNELPFFLMGESMGGAVALKAHFSMPGTWDGAVLIAPMCKISEDMYPPWYLQEILKFMARVAPKSKLVPSRDIAEIGFQVAAKRHQAMQNIIAYIGKPRLGTALSLLRATDEIEKQLDKVSLPLLILHGALDRVTDPAVSKTLYERSCSEDKTLHLYENSWHAVLEGESDETVDRAIGDVVTWLNAHSSKSHS